MSEPQVTKKDKESIRHLYREGLTLREIGNQIGASKQVVWYHVQKMDLEPAKDKEQEILKKEAQKILEKKPEISIKGLSRYLDCSWNLAKKLMKDLGVYEKRIPFAERVDKDRLIKLYVLEDKSLSQLSKIFKNASPSTLSKTLKEFGVPIRPRSTAVVGCDRREKWREKAIRDLDLDRSL